MQTRSIYSTLVYGVAISLAGKFIGAGLQIISQVLLARDLGPSDYGLFSVGWGFFQIVGVIMTFGLDYTIIRFGSEYWDDQLEKIKSLLLKFNGISVIIGGGVVLLVFFGISNLLLKFGRNDLDMVFKLFAIGIPFFIILRVNSSATRITQNLRYTTIAEDVIRRIVQLVLLVYIAQLGMRLEDSITVTVISFGIGAIIIVVFAHRLYIKDVATNFRDGINYKEVFRYSVYVTGALITSSGLVWSDRIILGVFQPASEAGLFQAASQVTFIFTTILLAVNTAVAPMIASRFNKQDYAGLANIFRFSTKYIIYLGLPLALIIFINPRLVLHGLYGKEYLAGMAILILLTITQVINIGTGAVAQVMLMTGNERKWFWFTFFAFGVNITTNLLLIPSFGGVGAAIGSGASLILLNILGLFSTKQLVGTFPYDRKLLKGTAAAVVTVGLLLILNRLTFEYSLLALLSIIALTYFCFTLVLFLIGVDDEDRKIFITLKDQLLKQGTLDKKW